jgi:hypothetical protein
MEFNDFLLKFQNLNQPMQDINKNIAEDNMLQQYYLNPSYYNKLIIDACTKIENYCKKKYKVQIEHMGGLFGIATPSCKSIIIEPTLPIINLSFMTFMCAHEYAHIIYYEDHGVTCSEEWADDYAAEYMSKNNIDIFETIHVFMCLPLSRGKSSNDPHPEPRIRAHQIYNTYNKF